MKRRDFLKLTGMTAAGTALAGCQSRNEKIIPYLIPPDEGVTLGSSQYYASACQACPAGCGILVRVSEGRAKKVEGNPSHPVNRGKLCARGQALVQELYHPDRLTQPMKRSGGRGSGSFVKTSWDEALGILSAQLKALQQQGTADRLALLTPAQRGSMAELTAGFMSAFGSPHHVTFEPFGSEWLRTASRQNLGHPSLPFYDLAQTRYLVSFGADFLEHHLSPVQYGYAFGQMRQARDTVRGHFTYVGGRLSLTGASADRWLPARPGSEGVLALGMARVIVSEGLAASGVQLGDLQQRLAGYDLDRVARETGVPQHTIVEVAREFATTRPSLAIAGEGVAFHSNGAAALSAVQLLNALSGSLNAPGGIYPSAGPAPQGGGTFAELAALVRTMQSGGIQVALIQGNPAHSLPASGGFEQALSKVPFIAAFSSILDDTSMLADLVLPLHSNLESWGDVVPMAGTRESVIALMQPVVNPLYDTRQMGDILLATAAQLGGRVGGAFSGKAYVDLVKASVQKAAGGGLGSEASWNEAFGKGVVAVKGGEKGSYRWSGSAPELTAPAFGGDERSYPLHLVTFPSAAHHGGAALPWLQQLPDTMSTVVWDSWVEINPTTAKQLGIAFGDLVEVRSQRGAVRLPAIVYPAIRPDMVAIPLGQGHRGFGRYANGRGVNPLVLLDAAAVEGAAQPAWHATRVSVTKVSSGSGLVTAGNPEGSYRIDLMDI